jgi:hypothetical protein
MLWGWLGQEMLVAMKTSQIGGLIHPEPIVEGAMTQMKRVQREELWLTTSYTG